MRKENAPRAKPVRIPLSFEDALGGLLKVNPKEPVQPKPVAKKPAKKRGPKK